jgi:hypothetical protein
MCIVSMVYDTYNPWLPEKVPDPITPEQAEKIQQTIADFLRDKADAERLDKTLGQPDCADPEKAKLEERVRELEAQLKEHRTIGWRIAYYIDSKPVYVLDYAKKDPKPDFTWSDRDGGSLYASREEAKVRLKEVRSWCLEHYSGLSDKSFRLVRVLRK